MAGFLLSMGQTNVYKYRFLKIVMGRELSDKLPAFLLDKRGTHSIALIVMERSSCIFDRNLLFSNSFAILTTLVMRKGLFKAAA